MTATPNELLEVRRTMRAKRAAETALDQATSRAAAACVAALLAGITQADLVRETGLTRETLRKYARAAGIPRA